MRRALAAGWTGQDGEGYTLTVSFASAQEVDALDLNDHEECSNMCEVMKDTLKEIRDADVVEEEVKDVAEQG